MILERCIHDGKRVLLIVPKSAEKSVWRRDITKYLEPKYDIFFQEQFKLKRHTDFGREGLISERELEYFRQRTEVIIIDEAHLEHHSNNSGCYWLRVVYYRFPERILCVYDFIILKRIAGNYCTSSA